MPDQDRATPTARQEVISSLRSSLSKLGDNMTGRDGKLHIILTIKEGRDVFVSLHESACWLEDSCNI